MDEITESPSRDGVRSRGNVLALLGGAIAGAVTGALGRPGRALAGHDGTNVMHLGENNFAPAGFSTGVAGDLDGFAFGVTNDNTGIESGGIHINTSGARASLQANQFAPGDASVAVFGLNHGTGIGVHGAGGTGVEGGSNAGTGVRGGSVTGDAIVGEGGHFGVKGRGTAGGVIGESENGFGVAGTSDTESGVSGSSQSGTGGSFSTNGGDFAVHIGGNAVEFALGVDNVLVGDRAGGMLAISRGGKPAIEGDALPSEFSPGVGVQGVSGSDQTFGDGPGVGVQGISGTGVGVEAISEGGLALNVVGKAAFSTAGAGTVPQGQNSVFVANPAVTAESHISVTLVGNPGNREVRWVARAPGSGFTVNVTPAPPNQRPATPFTYLIVEGAA